MSIHRIARTLRSHPGLLPLVGALVAWTLVWTVFGVEDVLTRTALGNGSIGSSLDVHEVLEALFVAAHTGVRWAAGVLFLVGGALAVRWGMRGESRPSG